jgi:ferredoxin
MSMIQVHVDVERCIGSGTCALTAPAVFDQNDEDGVVVVLDERPPPEQHAATRDAAIRCPASVIRLDEVAE